MKLYRNQNYYVSLRQNGCSPEVSRAREQNARKQGKEAYTSSVDFRRKENPNNWKGG